MKARITKKTEKKPVLLKSEQPAAKSKIVIKPKKLASEEKKQDKPDKFVPGVAGGVKIGGGLKSKLTSLRKPLPAPLSKKEENGETKESD